MLIEARGLGFSYGARAVLRDVSFGISAGEVVAVLGPNGVGKSTLVKLLLGLQPPTSGEVRLAGTALSALSIPQRAARVAAVLQGTAPAFDFSVAETIAMARLAGRGPLATLSPSDQTIIDEAARACAVDGLLQRSCAALSGGERQRVSLARALAQQAPLLVLDEPTSFLDLRHRFQFAERLMEWVRGSEAAVLWVLHDLELALRYATRVIVLHAGQVLADGPPASTLNAALVAQVFGVDSERLSDSTGTPHFAVRGLASTQNP